MQTRYAKVIGLSLTLAVCLTAQTTKEGPQPTDRAINVPNCPLHLTTYPGGYELKNKSKKKVMHYRLGCGVEQSGKIKVLEKLPVENTSIDPGWSTLSATIDGVEPAILRCVRTRNVEIVVVEVRFEDGSVWRLKRGK